MVANRGTGLRLLVLGLLSSECCQEAAALAVGGVAARGLPVRSSDLDGVRNLLRSRIEVSKAALRKEMSEADFCRTELDGARSKLETQSKVVEEKLRALKALGAKGTGHEEIDGEMAVKRARQSLKASAPEGEQQASSFAAVSSRAATGAAGAARAAGAAGAAGHVEPPLDTRVEEVMLPPPRIEPAMLAPPPLPPPAAAPPPSNDGLLHRDFGHGHGQGQGEASLPVVEPFQSVLGTLANGQEREREVALKELTFLAGRDQSGQEQAIREVGAMPVIQVMRSHTASAGMQQSACQALRAMLKNRVDYQDDITSCGGVEAVQTALQRHGGDNVAVAEEALWTMQKLSMVEAARHQLVPGIDLVAQTMQRHHEEPAVQESGCKLLGNLAYEEEAMTGHFLRPGVMEAVTEAMREHPHDPGVQEGAILALHNAACSTSLQKKIKDLGGEALVQHALRTHPFLCQDGSAQDLLDLLMDLP
mmetsp:Transcript_111980/g.289370  ORF Transcript_111980/g.289370 Transcript_111980/m.289370 type:complete len:477 (+) Transcript_111980:152-1582(+)